MRFAAIDLLRYGHFSDCRLTFRPDAGPGGGAPDLHLVYGANEAGKSTTLAAVTDLLFGFNTTSPFNFRFAYPMLRVGAVLEDGERRFSCRRRKARADTLVDANDTPLDEGPLLAMLRGQTRDSFHAAFSMDQARLRRGGQAIVDMQDELGKALFAATSGLVGIAGVARLLHAEAEDIWAPRASAKRSYTVAERARNEADKRVRDSQARPRDWDDARKQLDTARAELAGLEAARTANAAELRRLERLRRTGPAINRRAALEAALAAQGTVTVLSGAEEAKAQTLLAALDVALRDGAVAQRLLTELEAEAALVVADPDILAAAAQIDRLSARAGAGDKAASDRIGLLAALAAEDAARLELMHGLGTGTVADLPSRLAVGEMRDLALRFERADSACRSRQHDLAALEVRCQPLRQRVADAVPTDDLPQITAAVDAARALGASTDDACAERSSAMAGADQAARAALARLAPWSGPAEQLAALAVPGDAEVDAVREELAQADEHLRTLHAQLVQLEQRTEEVELQRAGLATGGQAVSADELAASRRERDRHWGVVRDHLAGRTPLADPAAAATALDDALTGADTLADRRFALAEASGRLAGLDASRATLALGLVQTRTQRDRTEAEAETVRQRWHRRLAGAGLPELDPLRLRHWLVQREEALALASHAAAERRRTAHEFERRADACRRLARWVPDAGPVTANTALAPMLAQVDQRRKQGEQHLQNLRADRARLTELEDQATGLRRQRDEEAATRDRAAGDWTRGSAALGVSLPIEAALPRLDLFEQLRARSDSMEDLRHRVDGIDADAAVFAADVSALVRSLGMDAGQPAPALLPALLARLDAARVAAQRRQTLEGQRDARRAEAAQAGARFRTTRDALEPLMARTGAGEHGALGARVEASRLVRELRAELAACERDIEAQGDGYPLGELVAGWAGQDPDRIAAEVAARQEQQKALDARISEAAGQEGAARTGFGAFAGAPTAADAATDAALARAQMDTLAEDYLLRRAQSLVLGWVIESTRKRRQNPLLARAGTLFSRLTLGRYTGLEIDHEEERPRLLAVCRDGEATVGVHAMSEGTTDQLFLALRLAAVEHSVASGIRLPFLADDLFVNFDDDRARAGLQVLAELAAKTQVLFFTHHAHLVSLAREAVGADIVSTCRIPTG